MACMAYSIAYSMAYSMAWIAYSIAYPGDETASLCTAYDGSTASEASSKFVPDVLLCFLP